MNTKHYTLKINIPTEIAKEFKEKFKQLRTLSGKEITQKIIEDEIKDLSKFEVIYYNDKDIKEIFNK